jgi:hypothetical protein
MVDEKDLKIVRKVLYKFIETKPSEYELSREQVDKATFLIDNEIRITGEVEGNFALFFVNYYDAYNMALEMANFVEKETNGKFIVEWYNPAYLVANKQ